MPDKDLSAQSANWREGIVSQIFNSGDFLIWDGKRRWTCNTQICDLPDNFKPLEGMSVQFAVNLENRVSTLKPHP